MAKKTLVYQMYPTAWENMGGFRAMTRHLTRVADLGADYVWMSPLYPSYRFDGGYDVLCYKAVDSRFGSIRDLDDFVSTAHALGIGVLMDLVLNHTSVQHYWFSEHPDEYYCWSDEPTDDLHNLFDGGSVWKYDETRKKYYLHQFHPHQADLNWFPFGNQHLINHHLVYEFQKIVDFWAQKHSVDGFRLDVPQAINRDAFSTGRMLEGEKTVKVLNSVFEGGRENLFLMMECLDPLDGEVIEYYTDRTPINFALNMLLKDEFDCESRLDFAKRLRRAAKNAKFMLDLESHDSTRFLSRKNATFYDEMRLMFETGMGGVCVYQGQELGLKNPSRTELTDEMMLELDAQTAMRYDAGRSLEELRPTSRANARVGLDRIDWDCLYEKQEEDPDSNLNLMKKFVKNWRR